MAILQREAAISVPADLAPLTNNTERDGDLKVFPLGTMTPESPRDAAESLLTCSIADGDRESAADSKGTCCAWAWLSPAGAKVKDPPAVVRLGAANGCTCAMAAGVIETNDDSDTAPSDWACARPAADTAVAPDPLSDGDAAACWCERAAG